MERCGLLKRLLKTAFTLHPYILLCLSPTGAVNGKIREIGRPIPIRRITIRNIDYSADGRIFAVPNFVTAGSVALFWVNEQGEIAPVPRSIGPKEIVRSGGLFYLRKRSEGEPSMAFISLPELMSGYSVDFSEDGLTLIAAGGNAVNVYDGNNKWEKVRSLAVGQSVRRALLSRNDSSLAVISDGRLFLFSTTGYSLISTVEPADDCRFGDAAFSNDSRRLAVVEYSSAIFDYRSRILICRTEDGSLERELPCIPIRSSSDPAEHLPLISWSPADTALAVNISGTLKGRVYLIKSNDGGRVKEFRGLCHAFSADGTMFAAGNTVYSTADWSVMGSIPASTVTCAFSPTERVIIVVTQDSIRRFRIEEK